MANHKRETSTKLRIGTSGWVYKHWIGRFYPNRLPAKDHFTYYSQYFNTVELNNTFYRLPKTSGFDKWKAQAPANFIFALKANRYITHIKRLNHVETSVKEMIKRYKHLGKTLGPILFQLPPSFKFRPDRLTGLIAQIKKYKRLNFVMEFRHPSWFQEETRVLLDKNKIGFCIYQLGNYVTPFWVTTNLVYIRFHGSTGAYLGRYTKRRLKSWANMISAWLNEGKDVYVYFNNDENAYAIKDALDLQNLTA